MARLDLEYVKQTCKIGQGKSCCRYLVMGANGFECGKLERTLRDALNKRVASNTIVAQGDNCDGLDNELEPHPDPE